MSPPLPLGVSPWGCCLLLRPEQSSPQGCHVCVEGAGEDVQANEPPEDPACLVPTRWTTVCTSRQAPYTKPLSLRNGGHSVLEQLSKVYSSIK